MPKRFCSENMVFTVPGTPSCHRSEGMDFSVPRNKNAKASRPSYGGGYKAYRAMIKMAAKQAMAEYGWEMTEEPLYVALTYYVPVSTKYSDKEAERMYKREAVAVRRPHVQALADVFLASMKGIVYKSQVQIASVLVVKRYAKEDTGVDVLIGKPTSLRRMLYDIRNA